MEECHKRLGDNVTILYDYIGLKDSTKKILKKQGKEEGGPWDCYDVYHFHGWEADRVVAVTTGRDLWPPLDMEMEKITRARTHLAVILVDHTSDHTSDYTTNKKHFQRAADNWLVDVVHLGANNDNCPIDKDDKSQSKNSGLRDEESKDTNEGLNDDKSQDMFLCFSQCSVL